MAFLVPGLLVISPHPARSRAVARSARFSQREREKHRRGTLNRMPARRFFRRFSWRWRGRRFLLTSSWRFFVRRRRVCGFRRWSGGIRGRGALLKAVPSGHAVRCQFCVAGVVCAATEEQQSREKEWNTVQHHVSLISQRGRTFCFFNSWFHE